MFTKFVRPMLLALLAIAGLLTYSLMPATVLAAGEPGVAQAPAAQAPMVIASVTTNCRQGPSTGYMIIGYLLAGQSAPAIGRTADNSWWEIQGPGQGGQACWVWGGSTALQGDTSGLAVVAAPPVAYAAPAYPGYSAPYPYYSAPMYTAPVFTSPFFFGSRRFFGFPFGTRRFFRNGRFFNGEFFEFFNEP